jgi:hypothetical protein
MTDSASAPRGRAFGWRKPPPAARPETPTTVFDINRWCRDADCSRTWLHSEWAAGRGPKRVRAGGKVKVLESPREYFERVAAQLPAIAQTQQPEPRRATTSAERD